MFPEELKYTKNHSWVKVEGENGRVGLTNYAQEQLSDIVTVELPEVGGEVTGMNPFGSIESVKATMDLITPVSGEIIEVNNTLADDPSKMNNDPYGSWIAKIRMSNQDELGELMDSAAAKEWAQS